MPEAHGQGRVAWPLTWRLMGLQFTLHNTSPFTKAGFIPVEIAVTVYKGQPEQGEEHRACLTAKDTDAGQSYIRGTPLKSQSQRPFARITSDGHGQVRSWITSHPFRLWVSYCPSLLEAPRSFDTHLTEKTLSLLQSIKSMLHTLLLPGNNVMSNTLL